MKVSFCLVGTSKQVLWWNDHHRGQSLGRGNGRRGLGTMFILFIFPLAFLW